MTNTYCNENYLFFEKNYNLINDKNIEMKFYRMIYSLDEQKYIILDEILLNKIKENWKGIEKYMNMVENVIKKLKLAKNLEGLQVEKLMDDFLSTKKLIENPETFLKYMKIFIYRKNLYNEIKELLLILSNKYTCELILNKNLKKEKCSKKYIEKVIKLANGNYDILIKLIYPKIFKFKNEFQKKEYENIYKFFTCLKLIEKYDLNPLKLLNINVPNKPTNKTINRILDELELQYIIDSNNDFDDKLEKVNNISEYILLMKKRGHTLWYIINYIWKNIYGKDPEGNIYNSNIVSSNNIELQKMNYLIAIKLYKLCDDGFISSTNIFHNTL